MAAGEAASDGDSRRRASATRLSAPAMMGTSSQNKRLVDPKDIAALAVFLASGAAKSISGQMMPIDNDMQQAS
jgi:NAD(P)-dependent dehydrogenase (short-subunit alcohol dehydrogenase family)